MGSDQVEFYRNARMLPGLQEVDPSVLAGRRRFLYAQLGIHPGSIAGRSILEFGPGSAVNAAALLGHGPARYDLVEADANVCRKVEEVFSSVCRDRDTAWTLFHDRIESFDTIERYDFVVCEGTIPMEPDPVGWLLKVARFCKPGGALLITCSDQLSFFTESLRRYFARLVLADDLTIERAGELEPVFAPHLATIDGMNRPAWHYILDNYIQPFEGRKPLSIEEATCAIGDDYVLYHCSIPVVQRWVWYKKVSDYGDEINRLGIESYREFAHNLADNRTRDLRPLAKTNERLLDVCLRIFHRAVNINSFPIHSHADETLDLIAEAGAVAAQARLSFAGGIEDYLHAFRAFRETGAITSFGRFQSWFGHSQQHVSFIRR